MARIAGINIPQNKLVQVGLTYIYGIGDKFSKQICSSLEIPKKKRKGKYKNKKEKGEMPKKPKKRERVNTKKNALVILFMKSTCDTVHEIHL